MVDPVVFLTTDGGRFGCLPRRTQIRTCCSSCPYPKPPATEEVEMTDPKPSCPNPESSAVEECRASLVKEAEAMLSSGVTVGKEAPPPAVAMLQLPTTTSHCAPPPLATPGRLVGDVWGEKEYDVGAKSEEREGG